MLAVVPGEPAGVGPELLVRACQLAQPADLVAIADPQTLHMAAERLGLPLELRLGMSDDDIAWSRDATGRVPVQPIAQARPTVPGALDPHNASAVIDALNLASDLALSNRVEGIVTGPTHKAHLLNNGFEYLGTTEWLAERAGVDVVMMLAHERLRVALVTTHLPLRDVADAITQNVLERCLRITYEALRHDFGIASPSIAVLGLNPHAGEQGALGREELEVYAPVLARLRAQGMDLRGPMPADTAFIQAGDSDAFVAAYHDQGLPVLKYSDFESAVNITLGLPYPRVAVDHGTALDLAGTGKASAQSFLQAIATCADIALRHRRQ